MIDERVAKLTDFLLSLVVVFVFRINAKSGVGSIVTFTFWTGASD